MKKFNIILITILVSIISYHVGKKVETQKEQQEIIKTKKDLTQKEDNSIEKPQSHSKSLYSQTETKKIKSRDNFEKNKEKYEKDFIKKLNTINSQNNEELLFQKNESNMKDIKYFTKNKKIEIGDSIPIKFNVDLLINDILNEEKELEIFDINGEKLIVTIKNPKIINSYAITFYINKSKVYYNLNDKLLSFKFMNNKIKNYVTIKNNEGYIFTNLRR